MDNLTKKITEIISEKGRIILAIDGPCASGKTTLANHLAKMFDAQVIHTDDFFLPPDMRNDGRLSQAGGNVHYERFCEEVVTGILNGKNFVYGIYSCKTESVTPSSVIDPKKSIIIEGAYSLHPAIPDEIYNLKVFLSADIKTRYERILKRNGNESFEVFKNKWIPLENRYFEEYDIKSKCDIIL